jgi:dCMP deaminase
MMDDSGLLRMALEVAKQSNDPSTKVGCLIVSQFGQVVTGFNSFPHQISETVERLSDRELKLKLIVHAEMNAVLTAARREITIGSGTMYIAAFDAKTGIVWGGPPCTRCLVEVLQTNIREIVSLPRKLAPSRWAADLEMSLGLIREAGITYRETRHPAHWGPPAGRSLANHPVR